MVQCVCLKYTYHQVNASVENLVYATYIIPHWYFNMYAQKQVHCFLSTLLMDKQKV